MVLRVPPLCPSIHFAPHLQLISEGRTALEYAVDRFAGALLSHPLYILVHSRHDHLTLSNLLRSRPASIVHSKYRVMYRALAWFGVANNVDTLLLATLESLCLLPTSLFSDLLQWHCSNANDYTPTIGLPERACPEVINTGLLGTLCNTVLPPHMQDVRLIVSTLLRSAKATGQQLPFPLQVIPFEVARPYNCPTSSVSRVYFQTPTDLQVMRKVAASITRGEASPTSGLERWRQESAKIGNTAKKAHRISELVRNWHLPRCDERPFRVLYISHASAVSGAQQCLLRLISSLDRTLIEPYVLAGMHGLFTDRLRDMGVSFHCRDQDFNTHTVDTAAYLVSVLAKVRPHLIHMNGFDGIPVVILARVLGIPIVQHLRLTDIAGEGDSLRTTDAVIAVSEDAKRAAIEVGVGPKRVCVVKDGMHYIQVPSLSQRRKVRERFQLPKSGKIAMMVARVSENKGQEMFIEAMTRIRREVASAHAVCVGEPYTMMDAAYHDRLLDKIELNGMTRSVTLLGFQSDILDVQSACDVLVSCSSVEALGTSLLEAMALEIPVVATRSGGSCQIVQHGKTGFLVAEGDVSSFKSYLQDLLTDEALRTRMGRAARESLWRRFSCNQQTKSVEKVYRKLLSGRSPIITPSTELCS